MSAEHKKTHTLAIPYTGGAKSYHDGLREGAELERERCAKVAETAYDATAEGREWGYCFAAKIRSEA